MTSSYKKSYLKWTGSKYKLLPDLLPLITESKKINTFCEPFCGSAVVSLNVDADRYILNDLNQNLIDLHAETMIEGGRFISKVEELFTPEMNRKENYIQARAEYNKGINILCNFVYLNRHCFNGLVRHNKKGYFNVPFGQYNNPVRFPEKEMRGFFEHFYTKTIECQRLSFDNMDLYDTLIPGDVVYFDPPYVPASDTSNFTSYTHASFGPKEQKTLSELAAFLSREKGIKTIISNSDTETTRKLYKNASNIITVGITRTLAAKSSSRKKATEIIAIYTPE